MYVESPPPVRVDSGIVEVTDRKLFSSTWSLTLPGGTVVGFNVNQRAGVVNSLESLGEADARYAAEIPDSTELWQSAPSISLDIPKVPVIACHSDPLNTAPGKYPCEAIRNMAPGTIVTATYGDGSMQIYMLGQIVSMPTQQWLDSRRIKGGIPYFILGTSNVGGRRVGYGLNIDTLSEDGFILTACTGAYIGGESASLSDRMRGFDQRFAAAFIPIKPVQTLPAPNPYSYKQRRTLAGRFIAE